MRSSSWIGGSLEVLLGSNHRCAILKGNLERLLDCHGFCYINQLCIFLNFHVQLACRLLYDILPGLEGSIVFQETEGIVSKLYHWAEHAENPLKSYAIGLLGAAMEVADIAANWRDHNVKLVRSASSRKINIHLFLVSLLHVCLPRILIRATAQTATVIFT